MCACLGPLHCIVAVCSVWSRRALFSWVPCPGVRLMPTHACTHANTSASRLDHTVLNLQTVPCFSFAWLVKVIRAVMALTCCRHISMYTLTSYAHPAFTPWALDSLYIVSELFYTGTMQLDPHCGDKLSTGVFGLTCDT